MILNTVKDNRHSTTLRNDQQCPEDVLLSLETCFLEMNKIPHSLMKVFSWPCLFTTLMFIYNYVFAVWTIIAVIIGASMLIQTSEIIVLCVSLALHTSHLILLLNDPVDAFYSEVIIVMLKYGKILDIKLFSAKTQSKCYFINLRITLSGHFLTISI